jgi:transcription elongation factor B subunit 1
MAQQGGAGAAGTTSGQRTHVKLTSAENFEFLVDYKAACVSNTIRNMLTSGA